MNDKLIKLITTILDFFYPIVKPFFDKQTYYYLACGGGNTLFALLIFYLNYHYVFKMKVVDLGFYTFEPYTLSMFTTTAITFPIGFYLTKYIVWSESNLETKKQFFRHFVFLIIATVMNYGLLKLMIEIFGWWAMPSQIFTTVIIVIFSYLTQRFISFKKVD